MNRASRIAALILTSAIPAPAPAQAPEQQQPEHRGLSLLLSAGPYYGFGSGLGFGTRDVGVRGLIGWSPVIVAIENPSTEFKLYSSVMVGPDLYFRLVKLRAPTDMGGLLGYRYDSLLGHGVAVGGYAQVELNQVLDLNVSVGFLFFPDGEDKLRQEKNLSSSTTFSFPGPKVNFGINAGLAFFP